MDVDSDPKTKIDEEVKSRDKRSSSRERKERERRMERSRSPGRRNDRERDRDRDRRKSGRDHWEPERNGERRAMKRDRSRSRSRRRSHSPRSRRGRRSRTRSGSRSRSRGRKRSSDPFSRSLGGPMNAPHEEAVEFAKESLRERRVYVGNLSYDTKYRDLIEFMRGAGEVLFAEVLITPTGVSKGCGIVEFSSPEDAQRAVRELSETPLLGRPVFIREVLVYRPIFPSTTNFVTQDRESESRFGATPVPGKMGMAMAGHGLHAQPPPRPPHHNYNAGLQQNPGNQLYVGNLPYQAGWQDLKDLFRSAGNIIRADINIGADGRPKGSGTVIFETPKDAQAAINMYHGFDWYGRILEVREDRYAGLTGPGSYRGTFGGRGGRGLRGGGGLRGLRGGFRNSYSHNSERTFNQDLYADYSGPDQSQIGSASGYPGSGSAFIGQANFAGFEAPPSQQIMVRNLPWSTANEDLVELFETTGQVEQAEILFEGARSKGAGVVQFAQVSEAETAIAKFQGYMYGGRPLNVSFNDKWHSFSPSAAKGGSAGMMGEHQGDMTT